MTRQVSFDDASDLARWANVVARNAYLNVVRHHARHTSEAPLPEHTSEDLESTALTRTVFHKVLSAIGQMSATDRNVLIGAAIGEALPADSAAATRTSVQRARARKRLHAMVDKALGGVAWLRLRTRLRRTLLGHWVAPTATTLAVGVMLGALIPWHKAGQGAAHDHPPIAAFRTTRVVTASPVGITPSAPAAPRTAGSTGFF